LVIQSVLMLFAVPWSIYYNSNDLGALLISAVFTGIIGGLMFFSNSGQRHAEIGKREGYLIVTLSWVFMALFGAVPYLVSGAIPNFSNAFFESISGFSTTGATILTDIEAVPKGILFWRSMTQWIGGLGIIVLTIAILPLLGIGGMELFAAEAPGPTKDKIHPRIKETAKRLWVIYIALTVSEIILLKIAGLSFYDAFNHALTSCSTGGFSTKNASVAAFQSPWVHWIIIIFMFLAGTNFSMLYYGGKGNFKKFTENSEFKWYATWIVVLVAMLLPVVYIHTDARFGKDFTDVVFQVVSIVTTTGYATADYTHWGVFASMVFFLLMFSGGSAGSTSGSIKIVRIVLLIKNGFSELKRRLHPKAVIPVYMNNHPVGQDIIYNLLAFIFLYIFIFVISTLMLTLLEIDILTAMSAAATCLGNVGPGLASIGPSENFYHLSPIAKWILSFLMIAGRLEVFTVIILFSPHFWRR
jgi:trk system potassium uptake protein